MGLQEQGASFRNVQRMSCHTGCAGETNDREMNERQLAINLGWYT